MKTAFAIILFVLAAGTLGNVQIMLSAGKHGPVPWRDNALVGAYFHDHLSAIAGSIEVLDNAAFHRMFDNGVALGTKLQTKLRAKIRHADQPAVEQAETDRFRAWPQPPDVPRSIGRSSAPEGATPPTLTT